ncbi:MAG: GNAT family N-acetyltransferase [Patescibacteria group bacterium]
MPQQLPKEWKTERSIIQDSVETDVPELQKVYDERAYIGELTGYDDPRENPMLAEFRHETLPPDGRAELHRVQSIFEKQTKEFVGYLICYHGFPDHETLWIAVLAIRPTFQRQKLGKEVIDALSIETKKLGTFHRMGISIGTGNEPAMKFWSSCGFTQIVKTIDHGEHKEEWRVKPL